MFGCENFNGYPLACALVLGLIHGAHASGAEQLQELIFVSKHHANSCGWRRRTFLRNRRLCTRTSSHVREDTTLSSVLGKAPHAAKTNAEACKISGREGRPRCRAAVHHVIVCISATCDAIADWVI